MGYPQIYDKPEDQFRSIILKPQDGDFCPYCRRTSNYRREIGIGFPLTQIARRFGFEFTDFPTPEGLAVLHYCPCGRSDRELYELDYKEKIRFDTLML